MTNLLPAPFPLTLGKLFYILIIFWKLVVKLELSAGSGEEIVDFPTELIAHLFKRKPLILSLSLTFNRKQ